MRTLIMSSSFTAYYKDENGTKIPRIIDNDNGFLDNLKKHLTNRKCLVVISGSPSKIHPVDPNIVTKTSFEMSGIAFDEYIYVNDENKHRIKEYIQKATAINLLGGHLPTGNKFVNELNLKELLRDFDGVIMGASGGAMEMADDVYCIPEVEGEHTDKNFKRILKGLALTDINIIPHFQYFKTMQFSDGTKMLDEILLEDCKKTPLIAIPDRSYIIEHAGKKTIYGQAWLLKNGKIEKICENNNTKILNGCDKTLS